MRLKIILTSLITAGLFIGAVFSSIQRTPVHDVSAAKSSDSATATAASIIDFATVVGDSVFDPDVTTRLNTLIATYHELNMAVSLTDLDTGAQFNAGLYDTSFKAASTAKVLTAATYLYEVQQGNATLNQLIDGVPAQTLLKQSIQVSDNAAWDSLRQYLGDKPQAFARQLGMESYEGGDWNTVTAIDMSRLLAKLYEGQVLADSYTNILFEFMAEANATDLIPAALPADAVVLHKYGELWGNLHDVALIKYQGHSFVLTIFTNDPVDIIQNYTDRLKSIHEITQVIIQSMKETQRTIAG